MIRLLFVLFLATGIAAAQDTPARVAVIVFDQGLPAAGVEVRVGDDTPVQTNRNGAAYLELAPAAVDLQLSRSDERLLNLPLVLAPDESVQIIVNLAADGAPRVAIESSNPAGQVNSQAASTDSAEASAALPGTLTGRVYSTETGAPVEGARVFVSGTPLDLRTDAGGGFSVELPPGVYSLSVLQGEFATQTRDGVEIISNEATPIEIELVPAGLELPEFVVLEPFVEGSLASVMEEQRTNSGVISVLGAESISRAGDSDAAGALKRVTGLTLVDGQFIYVRGLGERYSSTLLNGANVPSPDPTRRVVPLDLFPADILASVVVQKSYEANLPAEFGGGTIILRTTGIPESSFMRVSSSTGYHSQSTGESGMTYDGGADDWLAEDDGTRAFPNPDFQLRAETGDQLSDTYSPYERKIEPDYGASVSIGWRGDLGPFDVGAIGVVDWDQEWRNREEVRSNYTVFVRDGEINLNEQTRFDLDITRRFNSLSLFGVLGARYGDDHRLDISLLQLRDSEDETETRTGINLEGNNVRDTILEFEERELAATQLDGRHAFPGLHGLELDWLWSDGTTTRDAPDQREYRYNLIGEGEDAVYRFSLRRDDNTRLWSELEDNSENQRLDLRLPFEGRSYRFLASAGLNLLDKDRESFTRRFQLECRVRACRELDLTLPLDQILTDDNIGPDGFELVERTLATDTYDARQSVDAWYLGGDLTLREKLRLYAGLRQEKFDQRVSTFDRFNPDNQTVSELSSDDRYPAFSATWFFDEASQIRLSYGETVTRPEFREVSTSIFLEPRLDIVVSGNPDLVPVALTNYDLRYEHYWDTTDNWSVGLFYKELLNPLELVFQGGAALSVNYENAASATIEGVEAEVYKTLGVLGDWTGRDWLGNFYVSANATYIRSEIMIDEEDAGRLTNLNRELQGQSPYVFNAQLGYDDEDRGIQATLLYNVFGERISFVGILDAPDIYEQPFHQLDFVWSQSFLDDDLKFSLKLKNLLDDEVEFTQGDEITRAYRKGRELSIGFTYSF